MTDRIVTGTWVFASAIAGGDLHISGGVAHHLDIVLDKLVASGAEIEQGESGFTVRTHKRLTLLRRRDAALPGLPDRPAAVRDGAGVGLARAPR